VLRRQMVESFFDGTLVCDKSLADKNVGICLFSHPDNFISFGFAMLNRDVASC
jgi:hypothetical protein